MYSAVIFDLDGTLLDTLQDLAAAGNHTLSAMGLPTHPVKAYRTMVGSGLPKLMERMLPPHCRKAGSIQLALSIFTRYYQQHMQDLTAPYPGVLSMLERLKQAGTKLAVLSNKADAMVQPIVEQYFPTVFNYVLGLQEDVAPKPDPAGVYTIMEQLALAPDSILYCGDSDVDMYTAKNAGLAACGVLWGFRTRAELETAGADYLVEDCEQLAQLITG